MHKKLFVLFALLVAAILVGCGGGGGTAGPAAAVTKLNVFSTGDANSGFDHLWVTVKSISLVGATGPTVLYSDSTGKVVDLKTLRDASGKRFLYMNDKSVPSGTYSGATVVVDNNASVFTTGATSAVAATFGAGGDFTMSLTFPTPVVISGTSDDLIVGFNLSAWTLAGTSLSATGGAWLSLLTDHSTVGDPTRCENEDYDGTVNGLAGDPGAQTFALGASKDASKVVTTATTAVLFSDGSANPALANGQHVKVYGVYDATQGAIVAAKVVIRVGGGSSSHEAGVAGTVNTSDATSGIVNVTVVDASDFVPNATTVDVVTDGTTKFFGGRGAVMTAADFFAALTTGQKLEAEGTINGSGQLVAAKIMIEDGGGSHGGGDHGGGGDGGHDGAETAKIQGVTSALDLTGSTFVVTASEYEGLNVKAGSPVTVHYSDKTVWSQGGTTKAFADVQAMFGTSTKARVKGTYDPNTKVLEAIALDFRS